MLESTRLRIRSVLTTGMAAAAAGLLAVLVYEIGWLVSAEVTDILRKVTAVLALVYALSLGGLAIMGFHGPHRWRRLVVRLVLATALGTYPLFVSAFSEQVQGWLPLRQAAVAVLSLVQLPVLGDALLRLLQVSQTRFFPRIAPGLLALLSFAVLIVGGTLLLKTPRATVAGISWVDALFTSTSAACVTGLAPVDVSTQFTITGQFLLLLIIQAGGLGVMTLTWFFVIMAGQGVTLRDRVMLRELLNEDSIGRTAHVLRRIVLVTLLLEALGAVGLWWSWQGMPDAPRLLWWHAVFHSVSAFCNAGFSTLPGGLANASTAGNFGFQGFIMGLILLGGLGFGVFEESARQLRLRWQRRAAVRPSRRPLPVRMSVHWRLVMVTSAALLAGGTLVLFACDLLQPPTGPDVTVGRRLWEALFNSVTCRTAGFNITDIGAYATPALLIMTLLMAVGGSPGGTAGGIKTTTFAIALLEVWRMIRGRQRLDLFGRSVSTDVVDRCFATIVLSVAWITGATFVLVLLHPKLPFPDLFFETVSAFGTVGLSRNTTALLGDGSKLIIALTMLAGRLGILSFVLALAGRAAPRRTELPSADLPLN